jgi:transcriptional regulator with XRE-family HTH domain
LDDEAAEAFARPRPRRRGLDATTTLQDFALVTFDVDPDGLAAALPNGLVPEIRTLDDGRARGFVSAVSFRDVDFRFELATWLRVSFFQTNYRAYVRGPDGRRAVFFFGPSSRSSGSWLRTPSRTRSCSSEPRNSTCCCRRRGREALGADTWWCMSHRDHPRVDVIRFGLGLRALRLRRHLTQEEVAERAGISRSVVGRIERGRADRVAVHTAERVAAELGARVEVRLLWQGEGLDRLLDARHAGLVERVLALLGLQGWEAAAEVSFNVHGERGSIDVLGFHGATRSLVVVEVKSVVPDLQAMLANLDRKARVAQTVAGARGWDPASVTRLLVLPDDRTARRRVEAHAATFRSMLPARTSAIRGWIRNPVGRSDGVLFLSDGPQVSTRQRARGIPKSEMSKSRSVR